MQTIYGAFTEKDNIFHSFLMTLLCFQCQSEAVIPPRPEILHFVLPTRRDRHSAQSCALLASVDVAGVENGSKSVCVKVYLAEMKTYA